MRPVHDHDSGSRVLVLNQNYEPLNVCHFRRAHVLVDKGKAELLESYGRSIRTAGGVLPRPSVVRMNYYVRRPLPSVKLTRRGGFARGGPPSPNLGRSHA